MGLCWGIEARFEGLVFGVDEVGRGPWAGPVTAAAVCLCASDVPFGLADSKLLSARTRETIASQLTRFAIAEASVEEIDRLNIRAATLLAMARAVAALAEQLGPPAMVLVDGNILPRMAFPGTSIVRGDASVASIAAAAIAAKVHRDAMMVRLAEVHPGYAWERNKGYGTADHSAGLARHGITTHHRRSFAPIAKLAF
jgi:ribonuclease HII